ncbi:c-type cytochrome, partial [Candidatus Entotheonella palauensis]
MKWSLKLIVPIALIGLAPMLYGSGVVAQEVRFSSEYLRDPANITLGKKLWFKRCTLCHGKEAYPGSAPKLRPARYQPEFVYDRVTNGFRGMPAMKQ